MDDSSWFGGNPIVKDKTLGGTRLYRGIAMESGWSEVHGPMVVASLTS